MKQRTILHEKSVKGKALHTGDEVTITLKPAEANAGYVFRRIDLYGKPEIRPEAKFVSETVRSTDVTSGHTKLHTIEHILSALRGCGVDNAVIELNASEPPIMDGSARPFVEAILAAEPVEQDAERTYFAVDQAVSVTEGNKSIVALPYDGFKVTCTSIDDRGVHTQHLSIDIDPETYQTQIAPARTFTFYEDIKELLEMGKIKGGSLDSAILIKDDKVVTKEPLRFKDEFVRHKILDIIGDLVLFGEPIKAHIIAARTGHALNAKLAKALLERKKELETGRQKRTQPQYESTESSLDIRRVLEILPHRYPFLLVDRVIEMVDGESVKALKNVTINEPYFIGHFPGNPVMPGVLQVEAMAQAAGVLMLRKVSAEGKVAFFMSADKVKFRKAVLPGDQVIIDVELKRVRGKKIASASAVCSVDGAIVSSADLMFIIADADEA